MLMETYLFLLWLALMLWGAVILVRGKKKA